MAELVPTEDLPSGLVPESDLPETPRKTPKQMKSEGRSLYDVRKELLGEPVSAVTGRALLKGMEKLDEAIYEAGGRVTDITKSPGLGFATNIALQTLPSLLPTGKARAIPLRDVEKMATLTAGRELGLNVPPSLTGAGHVERAIESIGGKADIAREMSSRNREAIQIAARRAAGVPEHLPINEDTLAAARIPMYGPYNEIASISPRARTALAEMRSAREEAQGYWREYNGPNHPMAAKKEAERLDAKALAYEKLIDFEATKAGRPDLLPALRQARVQLAKNADVGRALIPGTGEIDARSIGRTLKKRGEGGMTGELQTIGKFAQAFPDFVQPKAAATDVSMLRPYASLLGFSLGAGYAGGELGHKFGGGTNYGYVMAALPFLSPAARRLALSKAMQSGALGPGASAERAAAASLIPLSRIGREDDSGSQP
jgi:hypothetical protein